MRGTHDGTLARPRRPATDRAVLRRHRRLQPHQGAHRRSHRAHGGPRRAVPGERVLARHRAAAHRRGAGGVRLAPGGRHAVSYRVHHRRHFDLPSLLAEERPAPAQHLAPRPARQPRDPRRIAAAAGERAMRWPSSAADIAPIQSDRKRVAVERAMQAPFWKRRIPPIDLARLDDPEEWRKIPVLTKEALREIPAQWFHEEFCIAPRTKVVEYWRSGGATGRPLFYPRSAEDMATNIMAFERAWALIGATAEDCAHISFPLGVHPVAHLYARAAINLGIGTIWCGAGTNTPSEVQLELIRELQPTVWIGMGSYGLHLANLAEGKGMDLAKSPVKKLLAAPEPLSPVKREKLERARGAQVFDHFGMTEAAIVSGESLGHQGLPPSPDRGYL